MEPFSFLSELFLPESVATSPLQGFGIPERNLFGPSWLAVSSWVMGTHNYSFPLSYMSAAVRFLHELEQAEELELLPSLSFQCHKARAGVRGWMGWGGPWISYTSSLSSLICSTNCPSNTHSQKEELLKTCETSLSLSCVFDLWY